MKPRRTFTSEFKLEAASLVLDQGYSILQACRALDVGQTAMRCWVDQLQLERTGQTSVVNALTLEKRKIQELEVRIYQLAQEKMILKKATALLMSDEFKHMRCV